MGKGGLPSSPITHARKLQTKYFDWRRDEERAQRGTTGSLMKLVLQRSIIAAENQ
jgi:hypothetical protein